jgi:transcriptional regulator GlxA family with amidase domain
MKIGFIIFDGMTTLDFAGAYDPVTRLKTMGFMPDLEYDVCSNKDSVTSFEGLKLNPDKVHNDLSNYDFIILPGGNGISQLIKDEAFISWFKSMSEKTVKVSICGGSILLGIAGFLRGKRATTHLTLLKFLEKFTDKPSTDRIVDEGDIITARGVTSSIDLGLYLCQKITSKDTRRKIQEQMDYRAYDISD